MPYEDVEKFEQIAKGKIKFLEEHFGLKPSNTPLSEGRACLCVLPLWGTGGG